MTKNSLRRTSSDSAKAVDRPFGSVPVSGVVLAAASMLAPGFAPLSGGDGGGDLCAARGATLSSTSGSQSVERPVLLEEPPTLHNSSPRDGHVSVASGTTDDTPCSISSSSDTLTTDVFLNVPRSGEPGIATTARADCETGLCFLAACRRALVTDRTFCPSLPRVCFEPVSANGTKGGGVSCALHGETRVAARVLGCTDGAAAWSSGSGAAGVTRRHISPPARVRAPAHQGWLWSNRASSDV